jgi:hypothetical protein
VSNDERLARTDSGPLLKLWILASVLCTASGWLLSAVGLLNVFSYLTIAVVALITWAVWRSRSSTAQRRGTRRPLRLRLPRRALPRIYGAAAVLALLGGALYAPTNYDALSYRLPRILHWAAMDHWYWITSADPRMNYSAAGFEWLMAPLLLLSHTDRFLYVLNWLAFLLLPGLVFSVFRQLGVAPRVAWMWMWLLPCAYCYVMQAGSLANDAYAAVYALAAVHYLLRAARHKRLQDVWFAALSAALLTGAKASNLPLLLPILVAAFPALGLLRARIASTLGVMLTAALVSFLPHAVLNYQFTGTWTGARPGDTGKELQLSNPVVGVLGNAIQLASQSFLPPVLPIARQVHLVAWLPAQLRTVLERDFPRLQLDLGELPAEESAGLGLGVTLLALAALAAPLLTRGARASWRATSGNHGSRVRFGLLVGLSAWVACFVCMALLGSEATARLLAPYYPLSLVVLVVHPANAILVRRRWWNVAAPLAAAGAFVGLILTPARPLLPAGLVAGRAASALPGNAQIARLEAVYTIYGARNDLLAGLRGPIPADVKTVGIVRGLDDLEYALWRPFGQRRVVDLVGSQLSSTELNAPPAWLVVKEVSLAANGIGSIDALLASTHGRLVAHELVTSTFTDGPEAWDLVELPSNGPPSGRAPCASCEIE